MFYVSGREARRDERIGPMFTLVELVTLDSYGRECRNVLEGTLPEIAAVVLAVDPGSLLSVRYVR